MSIELNIMLQNIWIWKHFTKQVAKMLNITQGESQKLLEDLQT